MSHAHTYTHMTGETMIIRRLETMQLRTLITPSYG
jgi:hypothetical protein